MKIYNFDFSGSVFRYSNFLIGYILGIPDFLSYLPLIQRKGIVVDSYGIWLSEKDSGGNKLPEQIRIINNCIAFSKDGFQNSTFVITPEGVYAPALYANYTYGNWNFNNALVSGLNFAPINHSHSEYALSGHTHGNSYTKSYCISLFRHNLQIVSKSCLKMV